MKLTIIIATGNENKVREIRQILDDPDLTVISTAQAGINSDPEENGTTFAENALIKARAAAQIAFGPEGRAAQDQKPVVVIADDSGLVVDALGGAPGVLSARYMGRDTDYNCKMQHIMKELDGMEGVGRSARFTCACAAVFPANLLRGGLRDANSQDAAFRSADGSDADPDFDAADAPEGRIHEAPSCPGLRELVVTRSMEGEIAHDIVGSNGFGYDPFFYLPEYGKTSAEITEEEKNAISHRGKAFRAMLEELQLIFHGLPDR